MMSDDNDAPETKVQQGRHRCLATGLFLVFLLAVAALVVPLVVDRCNCPDEPKAIPAPGPLLPPIDSPAASPTVSPPATGSTGTPIQTPSRPTRAPAVAPLDETVSDRLAQFLDAFVVPISGEGPAQNPNSNQYKAARFLAEEDTIGPDLETVEELEDLYVLAVFYYAMSGDNWLTCSQGDTNCPDGNSWMDPFVSYCEWNSILCNDDGRVTGIFFTTADGNGLRGSIPSEITLLTELQSFVAVNNNIQGTFPEGFAEMENIEQLILSMNGLTGSIAEGFLSDSPVQRILLSNNDLTGTIPVSLGTIPTLTQLQLDGNRLNGIIPDLSQLENLGTLNLANNNLRGGIPTTLYDVSSLERLYLEGNANIQGNLSPAVGDWISLTDIRLAGTQVGGTIPEDLFSLPNLNEIDFTDASFTGTLSENFDQLSSSLRSLKLADNSFSGRIPTAFDSMDLLNILELQGNSLTGSISTALCNRRGAGFNQLRELSVDCQEVSCSCCSTCY